MRELLKHGRPNSKLTRQIISSEKYGLSSPIYFNFFPLVFAFHVDLRDAIFQAICCPATRIVFDMEADERQDQEYLLLGYLSVFDLALDRDFFKSAEHPDERGFDRLLGGRLAASDIHLSVRRHGRRLCPAFNVEAVLSELPYMDYHKRFACQPIGAGQIFEQ